MNEVLPPQAEVTSPEIHFAPEARFSFLAQVWRVLSHPALLIILLCFAAGAMAAHLWLPQLPSALATDPTASNAWLEDAARATPGGGILQAVGAFDLAHNAILRVLLPLLAAVLLIHLVNGVLRISAARHLVPPNTWLPGLRSWDATLQQPFTEEAWLLTCAEQCPSSRTASSLADDGLKLQMCDCHSGRQWLALLTEIGLLLGLAALLLNLYSGWQVDGLNLIPGKSVSLAPYSKLDVGLSEDAALLTICCPQRSVPLARGGIRQGGVRVQVTDRDSALRISLKRGENPLKLQAIELGIATDDGLIIHFPEPNSERAIAAPDANLFFRLVALPDGGFRVQALNAANQMLFNEEIYESAELAVTDGLKLELVPTEFVIIRAWKRPWTWLLLPALLLLCIGLFVRFRYPYWRAGALVNESGAALRWQGRGFTRSRFAHLIATLSSTSGKEEAT